jgi:hypothetical protein
VSRTLSLGSIDPRTNTNVQKIFVGGISRFFVDRPGRQQLKPRVAIDSHLQTLAFGENGANGSFPDLTVLMKTSSQLLVTLH